MWEFEILPYLGYALVLQPFFLLMKLICVFVMLWVLVIGYTAMGAPGRVIHFVWKSPPVLIDITGRLPARYFF